jgi:Replication initiator protein A.
VGDQNRVFRISIDKLQKKVGSNSPEKKFKFFVKQIANDGHIPDYAITMDGSMVTFSAKRPGFTRRQGELPFGLPQAPSPALIDKARRAAPGFDVYALYAEWKQFAEQQAEPPRSLDAAFLGFCKRRAKAA